MTARVTPPVGRLLAGAILLVATTVIVGCGAAAPLPTPPPGAVVVTAQGNRFVPAAYSAPANEAFTLFVENRDVEPHNVRIWDATGATVFPGEVIAGPAAKAESVPALPAGTYRLTCDIHPGMTAELTVQ